MSRAPPPRAPSKPDPDSPTHPVFFLIIATLVFAAVLYIGIGVYEPIGDEVKQRVGADYDQDVDNIQKAVLQYSVPIFFTTVFVWGMVFYLRRERQTRRF